MQITCKSTVYTTLVYTTLYNKVRIALMQLIYNTLFLKFIIIVINLVFDILSYNTVLLRNQV